MTATPLTLLILEDSESDALLIERELQTAGYGITSLRVETEEDFSGALRNRTWDIIIADYRLPGYGGLEALHYVNRRGIETPFIIVSGQIGEDLAVAAMRAGAVDYILKDNLPKLVPTIQRELRDSETRRARKIAEERLHESNILLAKTFASLTDGILVVESSTSLISICNSAIEQIFGYSAEEIIGVSPDIIHPDKQHQQEFRKIVDDGLKVSQVVTTECTLRKKNGETFFSEATITQLTDDKLGHRFVGVFRDITDRKQAEADLKNSREQMRALAARLQTVREEERTQIAREIHDELGGAMTGLKIDLSWLVKQIGTVPENEAMLTRAAAMDKLVNETVHTIRRLASELRPGILDDFGLPAAIEWQSREFEERTGIQTDINSSLGDLSLDKDILTALFRIFQETLTNIARHADATAVTIHMEDSGGNLSFVVHDNGRGIPEEILKNPGSLGILGMKERTELVGGTFSISNSPEGGTTVAVAVPLS